jgi:hypothetical protein
MIENKDCRQHAVAKITGVVGYLGGLHVKINIAGGLEIVSIALTFATAIR